MTDTSMGRATEPDGAPRIASLDVLRGLAILGILFMNINDMGASLFSSFGDPRHIGWSSADQVAWWLREVLADGTARCLLEMLFGVGMVILTDRFATQAERGAVMRRYYVRNLVLFAFGLIHIFILLWPGDILHTYGIAALVAFLFRKRSAKALLGIGLSMALLQLLGGGIGGAFIQHQRAEAVRMEAKAATGAALTPDERKTLASVEKQRAASAQAKAVENARVAREDGWRRASTGSFATWAHSAWTSIFFLWGVSDGIGGAMFLEWLFVWEAAATMLVGAALYKWGIIQGSRSRRFYVATLVVGYAIGLGGRIVAANAQMQFLPGPQLIGAFGEVMRLATTLGHVALVHLLLSSAGGARLLQPFVAAGRTALSIYVAQTILCLWILYPPFALGLYGTQGWASLMLSALAINAGLLWGANVYLRHFAIAPVEWAWRSIIAARLLPIVRGTRIDRPVTA